MTVRLTCPLLALLMAACGDLAEDPASLVDGPRVLAIGAEPPLLAVEGRVELRALVVGTADAPAPSWRACSPWRPVQDPATDCPRSAALALDTRDGAAVLDGAALLAAFPPDIPLPVPPAMPGGGTDECSRAYDYVEVPVVLEVGLPGRRLVAVKRVRLAFDPAALARTNPVVVGASLDGDDARAYRPGETAVLAVDLDRRSLDAPCGLREEVRVSLYVDAGELEDPAVTIEMLADGTESAETTTWTAPAAGPVRMWLVAVDDDGGTGWTELMLMPR